MASNNMLPTAINADAEQDAFDREVAAVKAWWSDPRWRNTKRPFTAEQIVSKRGTIKVEYPGNAQSKKLWGILEKRFEVRTLHVPPHQHVHVPRHPYYTFHLIYTSTLPLHVEPSQT